MEQILKNFIFSILDSVYTIFWVCSESNKGDLKRHSWDWPKFWIFLVSSCSSYKIFYYVVLFSKLIDKLTKFVIWNLISDAFRRNVSFKGILVVIELMKERSCQTYWFKSRLCTLCYVDNFWFYKYQYLYCVLKKIHCFRPKKMRLLRLAKIWEWLRMVKNENYWELELEDCWKKY